MNDEIEEAEPEIETAAAEPEAPAAPLRLCGRNVDFVAPRLLVERWDLVSAAQGGGADHRVFAAAIGLCWPMLRKRLPTYRGDAIDFGGAVIEYLMVTAKQPATMAEIRAAGLTAFRLAVAELTPTRDGVKAAEDF